jgi:hypothetical protein
MTPISKSKASSGLLNKIERIQGKLKVLWFWLLHNILHVQVYQIIQGAAETEPETEMEEPSQKCRCLKSKISESLSI